MPRLRSGFTAGVVAYALWGLFPLYWPLLKPAAPVEILAHRVVWSMVLVVGLVLWLHGRGWLRTLGWRRIALLGFAAVLLTINWGLYIYAVNNDRVVESSLGYFINPLVVVALALLVLKERISPAQKVAVGVGLAAVVVLSLDYGRPPWIALGLAFCFAGYGLIKKYVDVDAVESMSVETTLMVVPALAYLVFLGATGRGTWTSEGPGHLALLAGAGLVTAVPLLLFGAAAVRIPLVTIGLLQYLTPVLQFSIGVLVYAEPMPASRLAGFLLVWVALAIFAVDAVRGTRPHVVPEPVPAGSSG